METKITTSLKAPENIALDKPLTLLTHTSKNLDEVSKLWEREYSLVYPDYKISREDPFNKQSHILHTRDKDNKIVSTARLTIDSEIGLPDDDIFPEAVFVYRKLGIKLLEFGRFISNENNQKLIKSYYKAIYHIAQAENVDIVIMTMKDKDISLHRRLMGIHVLSPQMHTNNGSKYKMACVAWELDKTKDHFFNWTGFSRKQSEGAL